LRILGAHTTQVDDVALWVLPGVLDPVRFRSGAWFARHVAARLSAECRLLDLGCGTGVVGALAQRSGAQVIASDRSRRAWLNARLNGLPDVRRGDLFDPLSVDEKFDAVCFNPPYFEGRGTLRRYRRALYGGPDLAVMRRFFTTLDNHLEVGGEGWMVLSDRAPRAIALAKATGWRCVETEPVHEIASKEELSLWIRARAG